MSAPSETIHFQNLVVAETTTNFANTNTISIINSGTNAITISNSSDSYGGEVSLSSGEALTITASVGFENPTIRIITGASTTDVSVMWQ